MTVRVSVLSIALLNFTIIVSPSLAQNEPPSQAGLSSIKGIVTSGITGEGLRKAYVRLASKGNSYPVQADDRGTFAIDGVTPGTYSLTAERQGFVDRLGDESRRITLAAGQSLTDVKVSLTPQSVISGRILDEDGDPWIHASVSVFRSVWKDGHRDLQGFDSAEPNDQGEFRIGQLPPGRYYLTASPDEYWEREHTPRSDDSAALRQPTWYPGTLDSAGAESITVGAGEQLSGLEIRLRRGIVHSIRGTVAGLESIPVPAAGTPFGSRRIEAWSASPAGNSIGGQIYSNGSFEIPDVAPGSYDVHVVQRFPPISLGSMKVRVGDRDVENVPIQLTAARSIRGTIRLDDGKADIAGLKIYLDGESAGFMDSHGVSNADGTFELSRVGVGNYRVVVESGKGLYVQQVRFGDVVASGDERISLPGLEGALVLTLSSKGARLSGTATATSGRVVLVPNEATGKARIAIADQNGAYSFEETLRPGAYRLFGFEDVPDGLWEDPEFMKEVSARGVDVKLAEGDSQRVDVPLITKRELTAALRKLGLE